MGPHAHELIGGDGDAILPHDFEPTFKLNEFAKRVLDIALATTGLILFAPILLISSVAIKLELSRTGFHPCALRRRQESVDSSP